MGLRYKSLGAPGNSISRYVAKCLREVDARNNLVISGPNGFPFTLLTVIGDLTKYSSGLPRIGLSKRTAASAPDSMAHAVEGSNGGGREHGFAGFIGVLPVEDEVEDGALAHDELQFAQR